MMDVIMIALVILVLINIYLSIKSRPSDLKEEFQKQTSAIESINKDLSRLDTAMKDESARNREEMNRNLKETREELNHSFHNLGDSISTRMTQIADLQKNQLDTFSDNLNALTRTNDDRFSKLTETLGSRLESIQAKMEESAKSNRDELSTSLKSFQEQFKNSITEFNELQKQKFDSLSTKQSELLLTTEQRLDKMRDVIETKLKTIQDDNNEKLEKMRQTVDDKLHKTLEERLGQSFQIVSERLEQVQRGLGEMQSLASGVGDLKKVLTNVRTRGELGEYRLEMILEQILAPEQYQKNVVTKPNSRENVEFAIKIPSKESENENIWLPIDCKFPKDRYQALLDAYEKGDPELVDSEIRELEKTIKTLARDIHDKYINPPFTTDFAVMFLPFEGLYAEVVKRPQLFETLQNEYKVNVSGPSTFAAFIHSLQMGFRTLAIQKRSSEVWALLGAVKTEFGKFGKFLDGVHRNLELASDKILQASKKSRTIERKLKNVQALPQQEVVNYLGDGNELEEIEDETQTDENEISEE